MQFTKVKTGGRKPPGGKKEVREMHCPHLSHNDNSCDAVQPRYNPSEFEVDEYCATEQHRRCPLYHDHLLAAVSRFLKPKAVPEAKLIKIK
jgi:hypothetical protein